MIGHKMKKQKVINQWAVVPKVLTKLWIFCHEPTWALFEEIFLGDLRQARERKNT